MATILVAAGGLWALVLILPAWGWANVVVLSWQEDLAFQAGIIYLLSIASATTGQVVSSDRILDPLPTGECTQYPDPDWGPSSLCAKLCLEPGDYTLKLRARQGLAQSDWSNELDLDISSTSSCEPQVARKPPPPTKPPKKHDPTPEIIGGGIVIGGIVIGNKGGGGDASSPNLLDLPNMNCVSWKITGACLCSPNNPCVSVEYWEPGWIIETVKKPGDSLVPVLGDVLSAALAAVGGPLQGGGGAANAGGTGQTNIHFNEVHVYPFPYSFGGPCTSCNPGNLDLAVHYASEADPAWRTVTAVNNPLTFLQRIGVWSLLYPRGGKVIHGSEPVSSGVCAVRGLDIAHQPIGTPPNVDTHVVFKPSDGNSTCLQLASPKKTGCFPAGTPPLLWEARALSLRGRYLWLAWRRRSCCVNPNNTTCGITAMGGQGANACLIPSTP